MKNENDENIDNRIENAMKKLDFVNKYDFFEFLEKYNLLQNIENETRAMQIIKEIDKIHILKRLKIFIRTREQEIKKDGINEK